MNLQRCENGHFYDADKFAACPHCESSNVEMNKTMKLGTDSGLQATEEIADAMLVTDNFSGGKTGEPQSAAKGKSLTEAIINAKKSVGGVSDDAKTISFYATQGGKEEPSVGVLLCVEGNDFGTTYLLKTGRNFIGRSNTMDVVISGDNGVSRDRHAIILYEPKSRTFIAQPGESRELFYVNDQVVLNAETLNPYDEISLGKTKLLFVPICGEHFAWEDYSR